MFLLVLNNTRIAIPAPESSPAIRGANDIASFRNNSVRTTLLAQLGINPIKLVIMGANILSFRSIVSK